MAEVDGAGRLRLVPFWPSLPVADAKTAPARLELVIVARRDPTPPCVNNT